MTLSIINGWEEGHFKAVASKGLHGIEFCANDRYDSAEILAKADEIKANSEKYDVKVVSIGRWGMTRLDESGNIIPEAQAHDKNLITLASIVGCPVLTSALTELRLSPIMTTVRRRSGILPSLSNSAEIKALK